MDFWEAALCATEDFVVAAGKAGQAADRAALLCRDLKIKGQRLSCMQLWSIACQLTSALLYLRQKNILHLDLKVSCIFPRAYYNVLSPFFRGS